MKTQAYQRVRLTYQLQSATCKFNQPSQFSSGKASPCKI